MSIYPSVCGGFTVYGVRQRVWRGRWELGGAYAPGDTVFVISEEVAPSPGSLFVCVQTHLSTSVDRPGSGRDWQRYWELHAQPGDSLG